ncbi:MAG: cytochrome ubiquinol oxidase subunit I, partial [Bacteroidota bacterium]
DSSAVAPFYLFGWVNEEQEQVQFGIAVPKMLSFLIHGDFNTPVTGLRAFKKEDRPPVNIVFQFYHLMIAIGMALIALSIALMFLWWRGKLFDYPLVLKISVVSVLLPQIANQVGWFAAEVGRQPWIVYGLLRTSQAFSKNVSEGQVWFSLILFFIIYLLLFALFIFLLDQKIKHGPDDTTEIPSEYEHQKQLFAQ